MLTDFPVLYVDVIVRRTIVVVRRAGRCRPGRGRRCSASPWPASGSCLGLAGATVNHRFFQISTARYSNADGPSRPQAVRRQRRRPARWRSRSLPSPCFFSSARWASGWSVAWSPSRAADGQRLRALWRYQRPQLAGVAPPSPWGQAPGEAARRRRPRPELPCRSPGQGRRS